MNALPELLSIPELPLDRIRMDEPAREPGEKLQRSIRKHGTLVPIHVVEDGGGYYRVHDGRCRVTATRAAGRTTIPAIVAPPETETDSPDLRAVLINTVRRNLQQLHLAFRVEKILRQWPGSQASLAKELEMSPGTLSSLLRVVGCPSLVAAMKEEGLEFGAARVLATLPPGDLAALLDELRALREKEGAFPSVRRVEMMAQRRRGLDLPLTFPAEQLAEVIDAFHAADLPIVVEVARARRTGLRMLLSVADQDVAWSGALLERPGSEEPTADERGPSPLDRKEASNPDVP